MTRVVIGPRATRLPGAKQPGRTWGASVATDGGTRKAALLSGRHGIRVRLRKRSTHQEEK